jgi:hypothetical protein
MIKNRVGLSLLAGLGIFLMACGSESSGTSGTGGDGGSNGGCASGEVECGEDCIPAADGSLAWVQAEVFDTYGCAASSACHDGNNPIPAIGFDLSSAEASHASLVDVESAQVAPKLRVAPNDVEGSYLVNKLTGEGILDGTSRMPLLSEEPLCDALIDGVRDWIEAGAPAQ